MHSAHSPAFSVVVDISNNFERRIFFFGIRYIMRL